MKKKKKGEKSGFGKSGERVGEEKRRSDQYIKEVGSIMNQHKRKMREGGKKYGRRSIRKKGRIYFNMRGSQVHSEEFALNRENEKP